MVTSDNELTACRKAAFLKLVSTRTMKTKQISTWRRGPLPHLSPC